MEQCRLCGRRCGINRTIRAGRCGMTERVYAARAALHMWEEPCISGKEGSGTVFFTGCPLGCVFCQNREIALGRRHDEAVGVPLTEEQLAETFLDLEGQCANNINLVTPTHFVPQIIRAVRIARARGLAIPIVYNTGSYETEETVRSLEGTVDIFLPDLPERPWDFSPMPSARAVAGTALREQPFLLMLDKFHITLSGRLFSITIFYLLYKVCL